MVISDKLMSLPLLTTSVHSATVISMCLQAFCTTLSGHITDYYRLIALLESQVMPPSPSLALVSRSCLSLSLLSPALVPTSLHGSQSALGLDRHHAGRLER